MDYLPISLLNQLLYCERRFWLMYVQGEMTVNAPVLQGIQQHEHVHSGGTQRDGDTITHRRVYLWSDELRVCGFADLVEEQSSALRPVEYKRGKMGRWLNDRIQVCAQALCLEERTGQRVEQGEVFYWRSRRRVTVEITTELRRRTREAVARAFELLAKGEMPPPIEQRAKCRDCSLEGICLPREVQMLSRGRP